MMIPNLKNSDINYNESSSHKIYNLSKIAQN